MEVERALLRTVRQKAVLTLGVPEIGQDWPVHNMELTE